MSNDVYGATVILMAVASLVAMQRAPEDAAKDGPARVLLASFGSAL